MPYFDYKKNFFVFIPFFKIANMEKTIYTFSLFLLLACGRKETITPLNISRDIQLSRKIQIQEKCFSNGIYRDSVLFFIAECSPEDRYIYMFNDSLQEIFRYGEKGRLFNEFNMPFFYRNCKLHEKDSLIQIYDLNLFHEKYLNEQLVNTAYDFINGRYLPSKLYFSENLNQIDNNTIIGNTIEINDGIFFIYNYDTDSIHWVNYNTGLYFKNPEIRLAAHKNITCANSQKKVLYVGYRFLDLIQLYDTNGTLLKNIQFSTLKKPFQSKQHTGISYDNPIYIIDMYATPEYCYLLRANMSIEQLNATQDHPCQILIMDWEGNLKNVLQIPFFITPLVVNEDNTKLFSIYPNTSDQEYAYLVEFDI